VKYDELGEKIIDKMKAASHSEQLRTTVFVTFERAKTMTMITRLNDPSFLSLTRYYLTCKKGHHRFLFMRDQNNMHVKIERAPEPEDVIWTNIAVPTSEIVKRKAITFTVTILLLGTSLVISYGLAIAQQNNITNQVLSLAVSICVSFMNIVIGGNCYPT
jgi:hypothetical protein